MVHHANVARRHSFSLPDSLSLPAFRLPPPTIATIRFRIVSGRSGHALTTAAKSGANVPFRATTAPDSAPPVSETPVFSEVFAPRSTPTAATESLRHKNLRQLDQRTAIRSKCFRSPLIPLPHRGQRRPDRGRRGPGPTRTSPPRFSRPAVPRCGRCSGRSAVGT